MKSHPIYLDHHATTPVDERVLTAMLPFFREEFGNAASKTHLFGKRAEEAVETAREQVATLIHAKPREIVWTSGATESINLALKGLAEAALGKTRDHLVTAVTEHKAVLDVASVLEARGLRVTRLPVDRYGLVSAEHVAEAITDRTLLVSLMHANNEIGTVHPIAEVGRIVKERGVFFHVDAAQTLGKLAIDVEAMGIDLLSVSAHKLYGPKGVGALYVRRRNPTVELAAQIHGGGHERGRRSGTLNVPGVVGFGAAAELARECMAEEGVRVRMLRDRLYDGLCSKLAQVHLNGHPAERLPGNLNVSFAGVGAEALMLRVPEVAVSSGSACTSAVQESSHVLRALGLPEPLMAASIRFGLGRHTTALDVDFAVERFAREVEFLRAMSPLYERG